MEMGSISSNRDQNDQLLPLPISIPNPKRPATSTGFRSRPQTGRKEKSKIFGDFTKVRLLQDPIVDKKVNFNSSQSQASLHTNLNNKSRRNLELSRMKPVNPAFKALKTKKGERPQTAKNYYSQNMDKIKRNAQAH